MHSAYGGKQRGKADSGNGHVAMLDCAIDHHVVLSNTCITAGCCYDLEHENKPGAQTSTATHTTICCLFG